MENSKKYQGVVVFCILIIGLIFGSYKTIYPVVQKSQALEQEILQKTDELSDLQRQLAIIKKKIQQIKDSIVSSNKRIYAPAEADLGNETLFFTLYNDVIQMIHENKIKIKAIDYKYNPETDSFVKFGKDIYFVCDVNMELISNYVNLGDFLQNLYQYQYYIRINELDVLPYKKDKKVLVSKLSLRLYAHTSPDTASNTDIVIPEIAD